MIMPARPGARRMGGRVGWLRLDELGVAEDLAEHRLGALVVGVQLAKGVLESLVRVANRAP
jgi:hypothetical protein